MNDFLVIYFTLVGVLGIGAFFFVTAVAIGQNSARDYAMECMIVADTLPEFIEECPDLFHLEDASDEEVQAFINGAIDG